VESLLTEVAVALVVRTRRPALESRPGRLLVVTSAAVAVAALALPFVPGAGLLGLVPLPMGILGAVLGVTVAYVVATEALKRRFFSSLDEGAGRGA
ncbi:MAG: magnesium-translocating P-type ATPase, partial [Myxococcaceae bacterium]|nr:magnesium-translocating P-type ATPase [Myxococcaceae bacterium]